MRCFTFHFTQIKLKEYQFKFPKMWTNIFSECTRIYYFVVSSHSRFSVEFTGYPPPVIQWFREGFEIQTSRDFQIMTTPTRSTLYIPEVFPEDTGMFTVKIHNQYGMAQCKAMLQVQGSVHMCNFEHLIFCNWRKWHVLDFDTVNYINRRRTQGKGMSTRVPCPDAGHQHQGRGTSHIRLPDHGLSQTGSVLDKGRSASPRESQVEVHHRGWPLHSAHLWSKFFFLFVGQIIW